MPNFSMPSLTFPLALSLQVCGLSAGGKRFDSPRVVFPEPSETGLRSALPSSSIANNRPDQPSFSISIVTRAMSAMVTTSLAEGAGMLMRVLQDVAAPLTDDPAEAERRQCHMMGGKFGDLVQLSLAVVGIGGLIIKRFQEAHPRPWRIWGLDVGKQCLGSLYAHLLNMLLAIGLTSIVGGGDECAWYFTNYVIDSSLGVLLCLLLVKLAECWAARKEAGSWQRLYIAETGNYGNPPQCRVWYWQTLIWLGIVTVSKIGLFFFMIAFRDQFGAWGRSLFQPLQKHPDAELVIVMVIVPGIFNIAQFWILDNLLKSDTSGAPAPPLSPSKTQHFKVNYEPIFEGQGPDNGRGRRRKGSGGAADWSPPHAPHSSRGPSQKHEAGHSWLRPMAWSWGGSAPGGPGQGLRKGDVTGSVGAEDLGACSNTFYKPPVPATRPVDPNVPAWMSSTSATILQPRRPYEDDEPVASGGALA